MRPLRKLPFRNSQYFETDDVDVAYELLRGEDRDVADMQVHRWRFSFKASSILLPHISIFLSSSDALTIHNKTTKDDALPSLLLNRQANAVAEQSSSPWNPQKPSLYQFYQREHRYEFETESLVIFVSLAAEQNKNTLQRLYLVAKLTSCAECLSGSYFPDIEGTSNPNTNFLMTALALAVFYPLICKHSKGKPNFGE
jgi:hypothetical protein